MASDRKEFPQEHTSEHQTPPTCASSSFWAQKHRYTPQELPITDSNIPVPRAGQ